MPRPCRAQTMPLRKRLLKATAWARHGMCELTSAVSRRPVGDLPSFVFFRLPRGHSRTLLIRMLLPFRMCLICSDDDGDSRLYRIINFYELILKLNPAFLLLLCYVSIMRSSFVCGQQLFQVFKFRNTHSKIFENFLPVVFQTSKQCEILLPPRLTRDALWIQYFRQGRSQGGKTAGLRPPSQTLKTEIKKNSFCRYRDIESFPWFPLQPKSTAEIGWWVVH
jgi:hypothetical protein